jgi:TolA-binding protein
MPSDDFDDELRDIKREIVESRGLTIRTNNLVAALAADLKSISKRQLGFERRAFWNSASANLLFVIVVIGVVKIAWDARVDSVTAEVHGLKDKITKLETDAKEEAKHGDERLRAEAAAAAYYELIRADRRQEVIDQFESIRQLPLSRAEIAFFSDAADRSKSELSLRAYEQGLEHLRTGRWHEAATAFEDAISKKETAAHTPNARLSLAKAYRKLNRQRDAIPILVTLSEASPDKEILDDATFLLAECLIDIQAWNDAKAALRSFLRRFPESPFANDAKMALADIGLRH